jgi:predicted nucleic acid-binding protein
MLCDSNIIIYAADPADTRCLTLAATNDAAIAVVSRIEVLGFAGFAQLGKERRQRLEEIVAAITELPLTEPVIQRAITLRQERRMSLADAIIAATALIYELPLATRNVDDYKHIAGLQLVNPFDGS